jgi:phosphate-selective porin OprO/OprP
VKVEVKTSGLTTFFNVNSAAKFNIIREVNSRTRYGAELAWAYGPLLLWGEYINLQFSDVKTSDAQFDINVKDYYGSLLWMVTGEKPNLKNGVIQPIRPLRNAWQGGWGALGLAFRYDHFDGGDATYEYLVEPGNSVREATAYTVALNWYLNPYLRLLINATRTRFDRPLLVTKDSLTGEAVYSDCEDVITGRIQLQF